MRRTIQVLAVVLALPAFLQAAEPSAAPAAECTCAAAFEQTVAMVEADYVGYPIKVKGDAKRREAYDKFKAVLRKDAAGAGSDRCLEVLDTYVKFFQDYHMFVARNSKAGGPGGTAARAWTEAEARAEIDRNRERLDPFEGIWYGKGGGRYAVLHEAGTPAGRLAAIRLKEGAASNEVVGVLQREGRGTYHATFRDAEGKWQAGAVTLHRGGSLLVFGIQTWGKLHPAVAEARLDPADPQAPLFARLDVATLYLSMPSFLPDYAPPLQEILKTHGDEIAKAHGLVIDLRGNVGGNAIYFDLAPYLLTGPIQFSEASAILASPRNLRLLEDIRKNAGEHGAIFDPALRRMRESPGQIVPFLDPITDGPPSFAPGPQRVALLVDRAVGSAAEGMVQVVRQSPRVFVVGENTRGNIDYQQVSMAKVGCGDHAYWAGTPLYAGSRTLPAGAVDPSGLLPDVAVPDGLADPLAFTVRLLTEPGAG